MSSATMPVLVMTDQQRDEAADTWQAYNAMEATKNRHFEYLSYLERKKKNFNLDPTEQDHVLLKQLLRDHDDQVKQFTRASIQLKQSHPETHVALFTYIGRINEVLEADKTSH